MSCKYFGTDGIRDAVNGPLMAPEFVQRLGRALRCYLKNKNSDKEIVVAIGRDTRASGGAIEEALCKGFSDEKIKVFSLGVLPTPAVAMALGGLNADMGIIITASHNPSSDNGIKLLNEKGWKLRVEDEIEIEKLMEDLDSETEVASFVLPEPYDAETSYIKTCKGLLEAGSLAGWKAVVDLSNGAACRTTPAALKYFGMEVDLIGDHPDGVNINSGFGTECPEKMKDLVKKTEAVIGIAHDGDADRLLVCDEHGDVLEGEELMGIIALNFLEKGRLKDQPVVTTIQTNKGFDFAIEAGGGTVARVDVGDRNVLYKMLETGSCFGGETSGHVICLDHLPISDGLITATILLQILLETGKPLSELRKRVTLFPKVSINLRVRERLPLEDLRSIQESIESIRASLGDKGQVIVRYSGTESKIRLLIEGSNREIVGVLMDKLLESVRKDLDVIA